MFLIRVTKSLKVKPFVILLFSIIGLVIGKNYNEGVLEKGLTGMEESNRIPRRNSEKHFSHDTFHTLEEIYSYLEELANRYPNVLRLQSIGSTYENRSILLVTITKDSEVNKSAIFVEAGIHAREWLAPAVAMYAITQLVENRHNRWLLQDVVWYFVPVANPDGYVYSHTTDRLWRKNRSPTSFPYCFGTDCNRNFDFHWSEFGSSRNCCSNTYHGPKPFSEPESNAIKEFVVEHANVIKIFLSVHSFGQGILHPWSHITTFPEDITELKELANLVTKAMKTINGSLYKIGNAYQIKNCLVSGTSFDWAKEKAGIKYSYTLELPPENTCRELGFVTTPKEILPAAKEFFEGLKEFFCILN